MSGGRDVTPGRRSSLVAIIVLIVGSCAQATPTSSPVPARSQTPAASASAEPASIPAESSAPVSNAPPSTPSPIPPTPTPTPTPTPSPSGKVEGAFGRRDVPPGGVAESIGFSTPALRVCVPPDGVDTSGSVWLSRLVESVPTFVCALGFDTSLPIDFSVVAPDGQVHSQRSRSPWRIDAASDPFQGTYGLTAGQGTLVVSSEEVWLSSVADVVAFPATAERGDSVDVAVAAPGSPGPHPAYLYRLGSGSDGLATWFFIADLGAVNVDEAGEGRLALTSSEGDEAGSYAVWVDGHLGSFRLE
jgi:hypothetical protein